MALAKVEALVTAAVAKQRAGKLVEASALYRKALVEEPRNAPVLVVLGTLELDAGRVDGAVELLLRAVEVAPNKPSYQNQLGVALRRAGRHSDARAAFMRALALNPILAEAHYNLALTLDSLSDLSGAALSYRRAIMHRPQLLAAHVELAALYVDCADYERAHECIREALRHHPASALLYNTLGTILKHLGELDESIAAYRRALELAPEHHVAHSNLVYTLSFHPGYDAVQILAEARGYERAQCAGCAPLPVLEAGTEPDRKLRIGYVSPDFRDHVQAAFMAPLLHNHDPERFDILCYANVSRSDAVTERLKGSVAEWRDISSQSDAEAAATIRDDRIDILVELTMHMARNRLRMFALCPAPVQVSWLAYPGTTGMSAIDYRLTDPYLDEQDCQDPYAERSVCLPETFWCYEPQLREPLDPGPVPALARGAVTFGCLNSFCKVSDDTLTLWASVLRAVVGSRLLAIVPEGRARDRFTRSMAERGVDAERLELVHYVPRDAYFATFRRIDISLDTLPYNGHTTSLDSFFMGVPVVTLVGRTVVGRAGLSQATNLGLPELVARDGDTYVELAAALARDLPRLVTLRGTLRDRMRRSPLMDAARFARHLEAAYRDMWRRHCDGR